MNLNGHKIVKPSKIFLLSHKLSSVDSTVELEDKVTRSITSHSWSFDDAHSDLLRIADTYFNPLDIKFRFFVSPDLIWHTEKRNYNFVCSQLKDNSAKLLNWIDISYLISCGHHIGSHGLDHSAFDDMSALEVSRQLSLSKERIAEKTGKIPDTFAIPFGRLGKNSSMVTDLVFKNYTRLYLSDNRLPLGSINGTINRRHSEFGQGYLRALAIGVFNIIGLTRS